MSQLIVPEDQPAFRGSSIVQEKRTYIRQKRTSVMGLKSCDLHIRRISDTFHRLSPSSPTAQLFSHDRGHIIRLGCMRERIRFRERAKNSLIAARIRIDLDQACTHLVRNEGWGLGDLYRNLILHGACGYFLTFRLTQLLRVAAGRF
jgi:hypothetical protein